MVPELLFITDPLGPHPAQQPCPCYPKPPLEPTPVCLSLNTPKSQWLEKEKFKPVSFLTRCLQRNFRWNLGHAEGQAAQSEIALDFPLLSSLPVTAPWARSSGGWLSKGVFSKVTPRNRISTRSTSYPTEEWSQAVGAAVAKCPAGLSQPALCDRGWREEQVQGLTFVQAEPGHFVKKMKEMLSSLLLQNILWEMQGLCWRGWPRAELCLQGQWQSLSVLHNKPEAFCVWEQEAELQCWNEEIRDKAASQ